MKRRFLSLAISALRWYIGTGAFDRIVVMVRMLLVSNLSGSEKRTEVLDFAKRELNMVSDAAKFAVSTAIEITLLQHAERSG